MFNGDWSIMNIISKAIKSINPNAIYVIYGDNIDTCVIEWHNNTTPIPIADIKKQIPVVEQEIKDAEANAIAKKESAKAKLAALGLDEEEIKALIGV
jgi:hypothetical protein